MTSQDVMAAFNSLRQSLDVVRGQIAVYEGQLDHKEALLKAIDQRIAQAKDELANEQAKGNGIITNAADEASKLNNQDKLILTDAQRQRDEARLLMAQAKAAVADAEIRSKKIESDEKALAMQTQLYERKRQALDAALKAH